MNKTKISAEIVSDSVNPKGDRLTSLLITFPRIILAEVNTHRMLSKNTSSSRAIPFKKMVESVQNDPFIPIAWQKHHSGMQGSEYIVDEYQIKDAIEKWNDAKNQAVKTSMVLYGSNVTKQLSNRLLEPFMWTTMLITGSKEGWDNFFHLRLPVYQFTETGTIFKSRKDVLKFGDNTHIKDGKIVVRKDMSEVEWLSYNKGQAEIHIMDLAEKIYDAMKESNPKQLKSGEWHIPFGENINNDGGKFVKFMMDYTKNRQLHTYPDGTGEVDMTKVKVSTAMAARTSYTVVGSEKDVNYEKMIKLHDRLLAQDPLHSSPMEHCAKAMDDSEYQSYIKGKLTELNPERDFNENIEIEEPLHKEKGWCRNFKGFIQYRHLVENKLQLKKLI